MPPPGQKHSFIQNALIVAMQEPSFVFALPQLRLSTWDDLLMRNDASCERERLEFVGDALMHTCVALQLYKLFPQGTPGLYTVSLFRILHSPRTLQRSPASQTLRAALTTNATFTHFMVHVGAFDRCPTGRTKVAADAFETVIAAYYMESGFDALCTWVADMLKPLIAVAEKASVDLYDIVYSALM